MVYLLTIQMARSLFFFMISLLSLFDLVLACAPTTLFSRPSTARNWEISPVLPQTQLTSKLLTGLLLCSVLTLNKTNNWLLYSLFRMDTDLVCSWLLWRGQLAGSSPGPLSSPVPFLLLNPVSRYVSSTGSWGASSFRKTLGCWSQRTFQAWLAKISPCKINI